MYIKMNDNLRCVNDDNQVTDEYYYCVRCRKNLCNKCIEKTLKISYFSLNDDTIYFHFIDCKKCMDEITKDMDETCKIMLEDLKR